jgi:hypothetical protein
MFELQLLPGCKADWDISLHGRIIQSEFQFQKIQLEFSFGRLIVVIYDIGPTQHARSSFLPNSTLVVVSTIERRQLTTVDRKMPHLAIDFIRSG